ncbi:MAG: aminodeoxychorismate/anthranilate synthase component II [Pseudomonadota bacterium]
MILVIDNYDSFTHNLAHLIGALGETVEVVRNDALSVDDALGRGSAKAPDAIVLSPGPSTPDRAGVCIDLVKAAGDANMPVFGVCLGMQAMAAAYGGKIVRAAKLMHGKTCDIVHEGRGVFKGAPSPFTATRYHSLVADPETLPACFDVTAHAGDDGEIMAIEHREARIAGVQFHPESIASEQGDLLLRNFLKNAR